MCNEEEKTHLHVAAVFLEAGATGASAQTHVWFSRRWVKPRPPALATAAAADSGTCQNFNDLPGDSENPPN